MIRIIKLLLLLCISSIAFSQQFGSGHDVNRTQNFTGSIWVDDTIYSDNGVIKITGLAASSVTDSIITLDNNLVKVYTGGFAAAADSSKWEFSGSDIYNKNTSGQVEITTGSSTRAVVGGVLDVNTTSTSNSGTSETDLITYTLPASTVGTNEYGVEFYGFGTVQSSNGDDTNIKVYFGSTVVYTTGTITENTYDWSFTASVLRTTSSSAVCSVTFSIGDTLTAVDFTTPAESFGSSIIIKCTGTAEGGSNKITQRALVTKYLSTN